MSERKVYNKYIPWDYDPSIKLPGRKKKPGQQTTKNEPHTVRMMTPFNCQCLTCGEYIHKAKKFNMKMEKVENESYLGIAVLRFYLRCPRCMQEISFKTDPKAGDYVEDSGMKRGYDMYKEMNLKEKEEEAAKLEGEDKKDTMKSLETRAKQSQKELKNIEEIAKYMEYNKSKDVINSNIGISAVSNGSNSSTTNNLALEGDASPAPLLSEPNKEDLEDEQLIQRMFNDKKGNIKRRKQEEASVPIATQHPQKQPDIKSKIKGMIARKQ